MKSRLLIIPTLFLTLALCVPAISQAAEVKVPTLTAKTPMDTVSAIHDFFNSAEGKVRFQLPSSETQYGWQHASRFYKTEQILRDGPISVLPSNPDASIAGVKFKNAKGETETVASHLKNMNIVLGQACISWLKKVGGAPVPFRRSPERLQKDERADGERDEACAQQEEDEDENQPNTSGMASI